MTTAQLLHRLAVFASCNEVNNEDIPVRAKTGNVCLRYFSTHAEDLAQLVTLTTTPDGQIHARVAQGQEIIDMYFR